MWKKETAVQFYVFTKMSLKIPFIYIYIRCTQVTRNNTTTTTTTTTTTVYCYTNFASSQLTTSPSPVVNILVAGSYVPIFALSPSLLCTAQSEGNNK